MGRKLVKIGVLLLIANALYQTVPVFWRYQQFKMALDDVARAAKGKTDAVIVNDVMDLAATHKVALERDWVTVSRSPDRSHTYIDVTWAERLMPVPGWTHTWVPEVRVDGWHASPAAARDVR
jgi:hypothetical protein